MRKILLVLTVLLLAAPAWATVNVTCTAVDPCNTWEVRVDYSVTSDSNNIRAFGIKIGVDGGAKISNIDVNDTDYYIFPGSIDINSNGGVEGWGSAVVDHDANANGSFILEMGSLYDPCDENHKTAPPQSGTLCTFYVSRECVVSVSKDTARGGVVMENGSDYANVSGTTVYFSGLYLKCLADWDEWDSVGRPSSWENTRQCHGDADGLENTYGTEPPPIVPWPKAWVTNEDLVFLVAGYKAAYGGNPAVDTWIAADFNHQENTYGTEPPPIVPWPKARVTDEDVQVLVTYYKSSSVPTDCLDCP